MIKNFRLRIAQLDLARQMETLSFIKSFIDLIADANYNALFLYMEWRIRTKTFDIGENEGYSPNELREVIEYAAARKIMIIPGLATFGHAELLLRQERFSGYSELREGILGRFFRDTTDDFCPSLPGTRDFLVSYLTDVAEIFKETPYFHVGGDEVWDVGFCSLCKERAKNLDEERELYLSHILFVHSVTKMLGKRMMFWDDMFEFYPELLAQMPRDIIMVDWQYEDNIKQYTGHLRNRCFENRLEKFEEHGFEYIVAPADYSWYNISSFTTYCQKYYPLGAMLTSWEKQTSLLYKYLPNTVMAGMIWSNPANSLDAAACRALQKLFEESDPAFLKAILNYAGLARRIPNVTLDSLTSFAFDGPDASHLSTVGLILATLTPYEGKLKTVLANTVLQDILFDCKLKELEDRSTRACWNLLHDMESEPLDVLENEIRDVGSAYRKFYVSFRREKDVAVFCKMTDRWLDALRTVSREAKRQCYLHVLFALPDHYGVEKIQILLSGQEMFSGVCKHLPDTFFEKFIFLPDTATVNEIEIRVFGYGGEGIAYLSASKDGHVFVPQEVVRTCGTVEHPEYILTPDVNYAFLGYRNILALYENRAKAAEVHSLTISMRAKKK